MKIRTPISTYLYNYKTLFPGPCFFGYVKEKLRLKCRPGNKAKWNQLLLQLWETYLGGCKAKNWLSYRNHLCSKSMDRLGPNSIKSLRTYLYVRTFSL